MRVKNRGMEMGRGEGGRRRRMTYTPISVNNPVTPGSAGLASRPYNGRGRKPNLGLKPRVEGVKGERTERPARHPSTVRRLTNPAQHDQESSNHPRVPQGKLRLASHPPYAFTLLLLHRIGLAAAISHREGLQLQTNF